MMLHMNRLLSVYLFAIAIFFGNNRWQSRFAFASNFNKPHSHTGKVEPFQPGDPKVKLDGKALRILKDGKPYQTQVQTKDSGRGLVVQDVDAPTHIVWDRILDYDNYANMVPKTVDSKNYNIIPHKPSKSNNFLEKEIFTRMKVGFPMLKLEFFVRHFLYIQHHKSLTWTLDYTKESDFDDSCGYWYIIPHPDDPERKTRLYYSVQVSMFDWVPKFVVDFMSSKALTDATAWVKKYSEIEWAKVVASGGGPQNAEGEGSKPAVQKESVLSRLFPFVNKKKREEERAAAEAAAKAQALEEQEKTESRKRLLVVRAGWRRYVLVSVVLVLAMYNASLLLGGMHEKSQ